MTNSRSVREVDAAHGHRDWAASTAVASGPGFVILFLAMACHSVVSGCGDPNDRNQFAAAEKPLPAAQTNAVKTNAVKTNAAMTYADMCDASAAVAIDKHRFIVASDEDNTLRVYDHRIGGLPVARFDLSSFLKPKKKDDTYRETDIEGAARLGDRIYWITSHGRNRAGRQRPSRYRLFATKVSLAGDAVTLEPVGQPCLNLLEVLTDDERLADFNLSAAASQAPKSKGALNIEGLAATPDGRLLIGFRNPIPHGKALIVPLENPDQAIRGKRPQLGAPLLIDLEGRGIRSIDRHEKLGQYVIVAGSYKAGGDFRLYLWDGPVSDNTPTKKPQPVTSANFGKLGPEAIIVYPHQTTIQVLSDDGTRKIDGTACKDLSDPMKRIFRDGWVRLPQVEKVPSGTNPSPTRK